MSFTTLLVPTYSQMLAALSAWLDKAAQPTAADALMAARLAPDMFPLATQIRFVCVQAIEGVARLSDQPLPALHATLLGEGRAAGDAPGSIADAQARIAETIALLAALGPDALDSDPDRALAHALPNGMVFDLTAQQYARDWALPQFYFHLMAAYAILRAEGVALGKADFVQHMFGYLRPGTMPGG
ncbi:DUF1993 domain-containing protein [Sphingomonas baiyangensis]|uniref:DUF1993 domain-containing protein n=1 Tax=Sphingomonas baiyangensis TaxID=2572576 RepID=A0A4U1L3U9_9SPHN|nr:DUF1993 domain-containing protein [Sphingomonas baiyangensis]TKD51412.1 DUF1993 domain-containing protein [Sphingomonas baiyangensis]